MEFLDQWVWFVVLLPLAALAGWVIGRRGGERHSDSQVSKLSTTYFRGLNYLLNEQPDKAIELFLHIAELDKDTFETQVALGHLFRRRGEVDRAIRLHQALAQRTDLSDAQKVQALSALGEDYMRSGLLDRAETVFSDLAQLDQRAPQALRHLIGIYQAERDWEKAIENAQRFEAATGESMGKLVAQFECELADRLRSAGDSEAARGAIKRAYAADSTSVRAGITEGRIEAEAGNPAGAVRAFERAARHDPDYLPVILPALLESYAKVGERTGARAFLAEIQARRGDALATAAAVEQALQALDSTEFYGAQAIAITAVLRLGTDAQARRALGHWKDQPLLPRVRDKLDAALRERGLQPPGCAS